MSPLLIFTVPGSELLQCTRAVKSPLLPSWKYMVAARAEGRHSYMRRLARPAVSLALTPYLEITSSFGALPCPTTPLHAASGMHRKYGAARRGARSAF